MLVPRRTGLPCIHQPQHVEGQLFAPCVAGAGFVAGVRSVYRVAIRAIPEPHLAGATARR